MAGDSVVRPRGVARPATVWPFGLPASLFIRLVVVAYAVVFGVASVLDYLGFRSARFDVGNAAQAIWNTAHGHILETTDLDGDQFVRLGSHVEPILLLFTPLWFVWSSPIILMVVQAALVSAGALPVFWLARKHLGSERDALLFAFAYLLYPATQWNALDPNLGFHAVSLALPLLLFALWWLDEERWVLFSAAAVLAAATNEQVAVIVGCFGLWYGLSRRRYALGGAIFTAGLVVTTIDFGLVVPHFSLAGAGPFADRYADVGGTPAGIVKTAATHPLTIAKVVLEGHKLGYLALLIVPLLGLCFRAPILLAAAIPPLAINLLSSSADQTSIRSHYAATTAAVLFGAAIFGAARTRADTGSLSAAVLVAVATTAIISPFWTAIPVARDAVLGSPRLRAERHAVGLAPDGVPVSTSNIIGAHLSQRRKILLFPAIRDARWVVVDTADAEGPVSFPAAVERLRRQAAFTTIYSSHNIVVMRRNG